jgi:hypothetical protein
LIKDISASIAVNHFGALAYCEAVAHNGPGVASDLSFQMTSAVWADSINKAFLSQYDDNLANLRKPTLPPVAPPPI